MSREAIIAYGDGQGRCFCLDCASVHSRATEPLRANNLASDDDWCDGCGKRLYEPAPPAVTATPFVDICHEDGIRYGFTVRVF